jgi:hypothetical protein
VKLIERAQSAGEVSPDCETQDFGDASESLMQDFEIDTV